MLHRLTVTLRFHAHIHFSRSAGSLRLRALVLPALLLMTGLFPGSLPAQPLEPARQVSLVVEPARLVASNIRLNRLDTLALQTTEKVLDTRQDKAVIIVVTTARLLAYGPVIGWRELALQEDERIEVLDVEDYAAFVTSSQRLINFNAASGIWAELATGGN